MGALVRSTLVAAALGALAACSFTTAGSFEECRTDRDCGSATACSHGYCLALPAGCLREEAGGTVAAFEQANRIPLAALLPLGNSMGLPDNTELQGLKAMLLAISEVNESGVKGRPFGLFVCDIARFDGGSELATREATEWMVKNLEVPAIFVSGSSATAQAATEPSRLDAGTLIISPNATNPALSETFRAEGNVWRVAPPDNLQARVLSNLIKSDFPDGGATRVDVIYVDDSASGTAFGNSMVETLRATGFISDGRALQLESFDNDIRIIRELNNKEPKATVLITSPAEARALIAQAKSFPALTRAGGHRWYLTHALKDLSVLTPETLPELDQAFGTAPAQGAGGAFAAFRDSFRTRYALDPNGFSFTSHSYDAMWLVMLASAAANSAPLTGPALGQGMGKLANPQQPLPLVADSWKEASNLLVAGHAINVEGASGPLDFDFDAGAPATPYEIWQVTDGGIQVLRLSNP